MAICNWFLLSGALFFNILLYYGHPDRCSFDYEPGEMKNKMSSGTKVFLNTIFEDLPKGCVEDYHVHAVGMGTHGTKNWVNPEMQSMLNPYKYLQYKVYMSAAGIKNIDNADQEYMDRLIRLADADPRYGKLHLFAFDHHYNENGSINREKSSFFIPNEYVFAMYEKFPGNIVPVISVHPERPDALIELEKWAKKGAKFIKWLPNAMRINPSLAAYDPYYDMVKKYDMVILTHTGHEKAVEGEEFQKLANPLLLERPLDKGVKIIMAHLASLAVALILPMVTKRSSALISFGRCSSKRSTKRTCLVKSQGSPYIPEWERPSTPCFRIPNTMTGLLMVPTILSRPSTSSTGPVNSKIWATSLKRKGNTSMKFTNTIHYSLTSL